MVVVALATSPAPLLGLRSLPRKYAEPLRQAARSRRCSSDWWRRARPFSSASSLAWSGVRASRPLRASISRLRNSSTVSRSIASLSGTAQKTASVSCWLRARNVLSSSSNASPSSAKERWTIRSPFSSSWPSMARPARNGLTLSSVNVGCGFQKPGEDFAVEALGVARLG